MSSRPLSLGIRDGPTELEFEQAVKALFIQNRKMEGYKLGIVMDAAERSLDTIFRSERPDLGNHESVTQQTQNLTQHDPGHIKVIMREIGEAVRHCHKKKIMHGDLKMLNILRVHSRMKLIDLDASAIIGHEFCGSKFSSGNPHITPQLSQLNPKLQPEKKNLARNCHNLTRNCNPKL